MESYTVKRDGEKDLRFEGRRRSWRILEEPGTTT